MANLVIVESPAKATTIKNYLGSNYKVIASKGHIRDLPKSSLGVDLKNGFAAKYINIRGKGDLIAELRREAKTATKIFLATDPDREGEAISWHLASALDIPLEKTRRVTFNEITKNAIRAAMKKPRTLDMDLVNSQQARRIIDRIVGYKLSPFLWKSVKSGLSAGRVQSVATRIIVERENEIRAFVPEEYWTLDAMLRTGDGLPITARFYATEGVDGKQELQSGSEAQAIASAVAGTPFVGRSVKRSVRAKHPAPPFTTSTLQQEAAKKLGFQSQYIMRIAQELYEGVNLGHENGGTHGLITYMRTDSLRVSSEAADAAKALILQKYGNAYYPATPRVYKAKGNAQDAHEAIRPANPDFEPDKIRKYLSPSQYKLYKLIWSRFIASQMASAELDTEVIDLQSGKYLFHASGYSVKFAGYMSVYESSEDAEDSTTKTVLSSLEDGDVLTTEEIQPTQHFTEPPPRFTEATLIKFLEEKGIGRPSTYAPIIGTILGRDYVLRDGKSLRPTQLGEVTTDLMIAHFPEVVDYAFTAQLESRLDEIEEGTCQLSEVLSSFYDGFAQSLETATAAAPKVTVEVPAVETDLICEKCGSRMVLKNGKYGKFAACPNFPACKNTKALTPQKPARKPMAEAEEAVAQKAEQACELCGGDMVLRAGRYGSFYACVNYPKCKNTRQLTKEIGVACPKCGAKVVSKRGKNRSVFYSCERYPACDFSSWDMPTSEVCPSCGGLLYYKKSKNLTVCHTDGCDYQREGGAGASDES